MRIRKPHRNTTTRVVPAAGNVREAIIVRPTTVVKGWEEDHPGDGRPTSSELRVSTEMESVSTLSRQASPGVSIRPLKQRGQEDGSNLSVDQLWQSQDGEEDGTRHYVRRSSNVARKEGVKQEEMPPGDLELSLRPPTIGASKRKMHPQQTETVLEAHPATAPEGSLLHTLYLQLLAAGSEGITLRDLLTSFKKQTALPSFGDDWKEKVRSHLKSNPHFDEVKGHYLLCTQLVQRQLKRNTPATVSLKRPYTGVSPRTTNSSARHVRTTFQSTDSAPAVAQPGSFSLEKKHEGVQTRRKAYEKTIEAVLTESAMEFEKLHQTSSVSPTATAVAASDFVTPERTESQVTPLPTSRKRKFSSENEELDGKTIRGSLQALQAKIVAETGEQKGVPCARKDDARKWRCPLMAMEGHTLCEHHKALQLRKRVRKQEESINKSRRSSVVYSTKLEPTDRLIKRRLKTETEAEICSPEKEDNMGGAHAVEALVDMQAQPRQVLTLHAIEAEDHTNQVEEEAKSEVLVNQTGHTDVSSSKLASDGELGVVRRTVPYEKAIPGSLKALQAKIVAASGVQNGTRCARKDGSNDSARKWQCPLNAMEGHTLCDHHNFLKERKRARYAAAKLTKKAGAKRRGNNKDLNAGNSDTGLPEGHKQFDEVPASLPPRPLKSSEKDEAPAHLRTSLKDTRSRNEKVDRTESTDRDDHHIAEPAKSNSKDGQDADDSNAENLQPKNAPKRWYVAAKKTAAMVDMVKEKSQERETSPLIRPPTIPPLPAMYGVRRKAVKNRSLLSL